VLSVLSQANERFERRYELKRRGYDMTRVAERVAQKNARMREVYFAAAVPASYAFPRVSLPGKRRSIKPAKKASNQHV
jgi:putative transposase